MAGAATTGYDDDIEVDDPEDENVPGVDTPKQIKTSKPAVSKPKPIVTNDGDPEEEVVEEEPEQEQEPEEDAEGTDTKPTAKLATPKVASPKVATPPPEEPEENDEVPVPAKPRKPVSLKKGATKKQMLY